MARARKQGLDTSVDKKATITVPKNKVKEYKKLFNKNTGFTSKMTIKKA